MQEAQLADVYRETVRPLYAVVARWTSGDRARTEDIVQETYLRAVRSWPVRGLPEEPFAWLRTVARNVMISEQRSTSRAGAATGGPHGAR